MKLAPSHANCPSRTSLPKRSVLRRRCGSESEELTVSICFPFAPRKRTFDSATRRPNARNGPISCGPSERASKRSPDALCATRKSLMRSRLFGIHQYEQNPTRLRAAIDPGMIGRLLDHDIARLHVHCRLVEHHVDFAGKDDGVVDRARAVH